MGLNSRTEPCRISVIVPTYNRRQEIEGLLSALEKQTLPPGAFEVIIVDDGSTDDTSAFLVSYAETTSLSFAFCTQDNSGPGAARNRGMEMAHAPVFAFTDTDCRPRRDWLEKVLTAFQHPAVGCVGGAEEAPPAPGSFMQAVHFCMTSALTTGGMRGKTGRKLARYYPRTFNMAVSRTALKKTGGFKPLYHGEDVEMSCRIKKAGFTLVYTGRAIVVHKRRTTLGAFFRQTLNMGRARITLARLHRELLEPLHMVPAAVLLLCIQILCLSSISHAFLPLLAACTSAGVLYLTVIGLTAGLTHKNPALLFLAPLVFLAQQTGYGLGFLLGLCKNTLSK